MPTAVADGSLVPAACKVSRGGIERCQVIVRVAGKVVGRGTATYGAAGTRAGRVEVRLSKALQKKLENSAVHATFAFQAVTTGGGKSITARRSVMLAARQQWIVPLNGLFESTRSRLTPRVLHYLAQVAPQLRSARVIRCIGNTDSLGSSAENRRLGMQRARQVCGQLRRLGVRARLVAVSRGESRPRSTNATIQGRWSNRRVELRVSR
jgi:outer membrane protein OmpA-like peptidoglycan-associated protein